MVIASFLLLVGGASAQFGPVPPAPTPPATGGSCGPASGCQHSCSNGAFDLSGFKAHMPPTGYFHAVDSQQHDYYFDACGAVTAVTCQGSSATGAVAIQTWGQPAPQPPSFPSDSCAGLGTAASGKCTATNATALTCDYSNGDGGRTISFVYTCSSTFVMPTASQPDPMGSHYVIKFTGPSACAGAGGGGTSWGTLFCILFPVTMGLYFAAGYGYNYKYNEKRGADAIPQLEYWKELPGLVKDGCIYSYKQTSLFVVYLKEKHSGHSPDAGLKQALASEDGEATTSYEEHDQK